MVRGVAERATEAGAGRRPVAMRRLGRVLAECSLSRAMRSLVPMQRTGSGATDDVVRRAPRLDRIIRPRPAPSRRDRAQRPDASFDDLRPRIPNASKVALPVAA